MSDLCCCSVRRLASLSNSFWISVKEKQSSSVTKNWDRVIPKAVQIFSREGMVGTMFLRYQEDIVDCVSPDLLES